jgi:excisionase family DNA binding protein
MSITLPDDAISYRISDVRRVTGLSPATVYRLIDAGVLPKVKVGTRTLIMKADLLMYLEKSKVKP